MIQRFLRGKKHLAYENTLIINAVGRRFLHPREYLRRVRERVSWGLAQMHISPRPLRRLALLKAFLLFRGQRNARAEETLVPMKRSCR